MFTVDLDDDPLVVKVRELLNTCQFVEAERHTTELGPEPGTAQPRARWRELLNLRSVALVILRRYADVDPLCRQVLESADRDNDQAGRIQALSYALVADYFLDKKAKSLTRLHEVLAAAEEMPPGTARMAAFVAIAAGAGMIGITELSDQLMSQVIGQVADAPPGTIRPGVCLFLRLMTATRRCHRAIAQEQHDPDLAVDLYRNVLQLAGEAGRNGIEGATSEGPGPDRFAALYLSHWCFAKIAVGESEDVEHTVPSVRVSGDIRSPDMVDINVELMWGLCRLRLALRAHVLSAEEQCRLQEFAKRLTHLATRTGTLVLQAEATRLYLQVARRGGDPLLCAALREQHEAAVHELDWAGRLERAGFCRRRPKTLDHR